MATSFAAYASQYLTRQQQGTASMSSSHPMFFSFSTDEGSRAGHDRDTDLDDLDDPHFHESQVRRGDYNSRDDDDDPYLRLDEDEHMSRTGFNSRNFNPQSIPLIASDSGSTASDSPKGWLAHLASASPVRARSPSPSPSDSDSTDSSPPPDLFAPSAPRVHPSQPLPPPTTIHGPASLSLTESLLPRDGRTRPLDVFSLPDPRHTPRRRRKYHDSVWTAVWCAGVGFSVVFCIVLLFVARKPRVKLPRGGLPYTTLLHTVPMLTILTVLSALVAYTHIFLLRVFVRPVMIATSVFIPATLFISAVWAFVGSFMWDGDTEPTWGETVGLRLFSLIPLALSIYTARKLVNLPRDIHVTSSTLTLTSRLLIENPFLLALSPGILLITFIGSIPFLTLIFRLLLIGYASHPYKDNSTLEWHVHAWANWMIALTVGIWLWSWGVARGVMRMTCAGVIGAWYFADPDALPPPPMSTHTIHAALVRATGPSLGTIALSALILTIIRLLTLLTLFLERLPLYLPANAFVVNNAVRLAIGYLDSVTMALSKYVLVYAGLTGDPFMPSARRARALTSGVESNARNGARRFSSEPPLTLLTVAPLTLTFPFALTTYLFVAHTLDAPKQALGAALLAGGVTALVGLFCVGLVKDTADTLYMCYCIDKDVGERRRDEVFMTFEYEPRQPVRRGRQPEHIVPRPARTSTQTQKPAPQRSHQPVSRRQPESVPTYPEPRQPRQQLPASTSTLQQTQRPTPLAPSAPPLQEEDPDPFQRSFVEDTLPAPLHLQPEPMHSPPLQLPRDFMRSPPPRMKTSAELNMKSHVDLRRIDSDSDSEGEGEDSGSQFFPGSGFF